MSRSAKRLHGYPSAFVLLVLAPIAYGSLWESNDWALTSALSGSLGYDSNLTVSHDGLGDMFVSANPYLTFARHNSSTDFRINGGVTHTVFMNERQPNQTDLKLDAIYAYPNANDVLPVYRAEAFWLKSSQPNIYLGERVQTKQLFFDSEGYLPLTGKLGLRGTAAFDQKKFDSVKLNQSNRGEAFLGLAFQHDKRTELSLNVGAALGHSKPNDPARTFDLVDSTEYYATIRLRGEVTAKLTGSVYVGFGRVSYTRGYVNRINLPVGGADLTWTADPHRRLTLTAYSGANYAPDGQTEKSSRASLTFTHEIIERWQYNLQIGTTHAIYSRTVQDRSDESWDVGTEFAYQPSLRFRVSLAWHHTSQNSSKDFAEYKRDLFTLGSTYHF